MSNKQKITYLLAEVKRLEELLAGVQDAEIYPLSFFNQSFDLTRELLKELHRLEEQQVESLRKQMEARQAMLRESLLQASVQPVPVILPEEKPEQETVVEIIEETAAESPIPAEPETVVPKVEQPVPEQPEIQEPIQSVVEKTEKTIEELLKEYAPPQPLVPEKEKPSVEEMIGKKNLADFKKAFSLNDRFYFLRELFEGNDNRMNEVISDLNQMETLEESLDYLNTKMRWNPEDTPVADFIQLLEKRFS